MANVYNNYLYVSDFGGDSYSIRLNVNSGLAQPTQPAVQTTTTTPTRRESARVSGSSRRLGVRARYVNLTRSVTGGTGAGAVTRKYTTKLAILLAADFNTLVKGSTVTINGVAWQVSSKSGEDIK
jgi:hypothetical protein